ncbi:hypothetical protein MPSEU_000090200 [Mayamaea pseudoterrestris]|nr:hypothetical protein MPSEU_000090200 [Mayamaea pseudoterrestris]
MTKTDDASTPDNASSIHNNQWLFFPWHTSAIASIGRHHQHHPRLTDADANHDDNDSRNDYILTQFPPYGSTQQRSQHPDVPPDWLNHLSQLSALATLSEQQQADAISSSKHGAAQSNANEKQAEETLDFEWEASEQELWMVPSSLQQQQQGDPAKGNAAISNVNVVKDSKGRRKDKRQGDSAIEEQVGDVVPDDSLSWRERRKQRLQLQLLENQPQCRKCQATMTPLSVSQNVCVKCRWKEKCNLVSATKQVVKEDKTAVADQAMKEMPDQCVTNPVAPSLDNPKSPDIQSKASEDLHLHGAKNSRTDDSAAAVVKVPSVEALPASQSSTTAPATRREGNVHLGATAASHLQVVAKHLLQLHAPILWNMHATSISSKKKPISADRHHAAWINTLLMFATKTVSRVNPNVKENGDLLDVCPHVKIKTIAGGRDLGRDCAYFSGVMFRKTVSHKVMRANIHQPRILLLQNGIEFYQPMLSMVSSSNVSAGSGRHADVGRGAISRSGSTISAATSSSRRGGSAGNANAAGASTNAGTAASATDEPVVLSSLDTLMEFEDKFLDRLVSQLVQKFRPDVLMTGGTVSRRALEMLSQSNVTVISHLKPNLLQRIARQTQAKILTAEEIKNLMLHPDNDMDGAALEETMVGRCHRFRMVTFRDNEVWTDNAEAQSARRVAEDAVLALPRRPLRSIEALLADPEAMYHDRQAALVARQLGEHVLDGSEAVKAGLAKRGVAQTFVLLEGCPKHLGCTVVLRGAQKDALKQLKVVFRFLVNVAYNLRLETSYFRERSVRIRPGFQISDRNAFSSSLCVDYGAPPAGKKVRPWNGSNAEKIPRTSTGEITAFDHQSILITSVWMTQKSQCCPAEVKGICYYSMQDVALGQFLRDSCFNLSLKCQNPNCKKSVLDHSLSFVHNDGLVSITVEELDEELSQIPRESSATRPASDKKSSASTETDRPIYTWSLCKNCNKIVSPLRLVGEDTWKYSFGKFLESFFYNRDAIFNAVESNCCCEIQPAARLYFGCDKLAAQFNYEPIRPFGVYVRRTLPMETSFQREEGLRRLDIISGASSTLFIRFDERIEKISRETRSLFNSPSVRPEHLQTVLSELNRMSSYVDDATKSLQDKIASVSDSLRRLENEDQINAALFRFPWFARRYLFMLTYAWNEKLSAAGHAISTMKKLASSPSTRDQGIASNVAINMGDPWSDELMESMKQLRKLNEHYTRYNMADITETLPQLPETDSELQQDGDYEDDFDKEEESAVDFAESVDADVVASRRRLQAKGIMDRSSSRPRAVKSLGTRRSDSFRTEAEDSLTAPTKNTPGGAVKSALNRFFNRGGREQDPYTVDLGVFAEGRPRLAPGVNGLVVPVFDDQLSTVIAYSLSSTEYAKQFKYFSRQESATDSDALTEGEGGSDKASTDQRGNTSQGNSLPVNGDLSSKNEATQSSSNAGPVHQASVQMDVKSVENRMLVRSKSHVKHTFRDFDEKGQATCKFVCTTYWATQFHAVRQVFLSRSTIANASETVDDDSEGIEQSYIESLSSAAFWAASGGKSGASFHRTSDDRFVIKFISRTELQMFLDCAPAYFEYLSKAFFHGLPTVLCKIVGVYQIGVHNRVTGKRTMEQVAVMQNIFYNRKMSRVFDLKGSLRGRFAAHVHRSKDESSPETPSATGSDAMGGSMVKPNSVDERETNDANDGKEAAAGDDEANQGEHGLPTLLDGDYLEWTSGRPMPLTDRAKAVFQMSILNDSLFLSIINVLDYSILVGIDEENQELVVGIIDFMRQYDIMKQMERVGKSLPMVVGSEAPTIIQPPLYKARFTNAMERYFMGIPNKWTTI